MADGKNWGEFISMVEERHTRDFICFDQNYKKKGK